MTFIRTVVKKSRLASCLFLYVIKAVKPEMYNYYLDEVMKFYPNQEENNYRLILLEVFRNAVLYGVLPEEYFFFRFEELSDKGKRSYISDRDRNILLAKINSREDWEIFFNKGKTYDVYHKYYGREVRVISSLADKETFIDFVRFNNVFVVKPIESSRGKGVKLVCLDGQDVESLLYSLVSEYSGGVVLEEAIRQHSIMSSLNESSVNTVRCPTIITNGEVHIFYPILRIGRKGSFVDNGSAGGILASIDPDSGIVFTEGKDEKGNSYIKHPDSGMVIPGFVLPDWDGMLAKVRELAKVLPSTRYVGWDMAYTEKGWIVVEGNNYGQFSVLQIPLGKGIKKDIEEIIYDKKY